MKILQIIAILGVPVAATASGFFDLPNSENIRSRLEKAKLDIFDAKHDSVLPNTFDDWSAEELKSWLNYHRLKAEGDSKQLLDTVLANKDLLVDDIKSYIATSKDHKWLHKGKEFYTNIKNAVGINKDEATEGVKAAVDDAKNAMGDAKDSAAEKLEKVHANVKKAATDNKDGIVNNVKAAASDAKAAINAQGNKVVDAKDNLIKKGTQQVKNAKDTVQEHAQNAYDFATQWSDESIRDFIEARGIQVPLKATRKELNELLEQAKGRAVELKDQAAGPIQRFWLDSWSTDDLMALLKNTGESIEGTRDELASRLMSLYNKASTEFSKVSSGGADQSKELMSSVSKWKDANFNSWSMPDLQEYLKKFGDQAVGTKDELVAKAYENYRYFVYGEVKPKGIKGTISSYYNSFSNFLSNFVIPRAKFDL